MMLCTPIWPSNNIAVIECQIDDALSELLNHVSHSPSNRSDPRIVNRVFGVAVPKMVLD